MKTSRLSSINNLCRKTNDIIIDDIREDIEEIHISFSKLKTIAMPLHFWMFDRALDYIRFYREKAFPIGAAIRPPYLKDSIDIEMFIWVSTTNHLFFTHPVSSPLIYIP